MLQQKFTVQVTTLPYCGDITRFDGTLDAMDLAPLQPGILYDKALNFRGKF
jgi:hypothetical protein